MKDVNDMIGDREWFVRKTPADGLCRQLVADFLTTPKSWIEEHVPFHPDFPIALPEDYIIDFRVLSKPGEEYMVFRGNRSTKLLMVETTEQTVTNHLSEQVSPDAEKLLHCECAGAAEMRGLSSEAINSMDITDRIDFNRIEGTDLVSVHFEVKNGASGAYSYMMLAALSPDAICRWLSDETYRNPERFYQEYDALTGAKNLSQRIDPRKKGSKDFHVKRRHGTEYSVLIEVSAVTCEELGCFWASCSNSAASINVESGRVIGIDMQQTYIKTYCQDAQGIPCVP